MVRVKEVIVVEGRYDQNTLRQVVDADVICTDGFAIFRDGERQALLRRLAEKRGLIVLTDPDGAGEVIRGFLSGIVPTGAVKHAFIPDIPGKEKRKSSPSKEGKLGVEGMAPEAILRALQTAGATIDDAPPPRREGITPGVLYALGLSGTPDSAEKRRRLQKALEMPERMSTKQLLMALNVLFTPEELRAEMERIDLHEPVQQKCQGEGAE
jgi:ribonuclease M5